MHLEGGKCHDDCLRWLLSPKPSFINSTTILHGRSRWNAIILISMAHEWGRLSCKSIRKIYMLDIALFSKTEMGSQNRSPKMMSEISLTLSTFSICKKEAHLLMDIATSVYALIVHKPMTITSQILSFISFWVNQEISTRQMSAENKMRYRL